MQIDAVVPMRVSVDIDMEHPYACGKFCRYMTEKGICRLYKATLLRGCRCRSCVHDIPLKSTADVAPEYLHFYERHGFTDAQLADILDNDVSTVAMRASLASKWQARGDRLSRSTTVADTQACGYGRTNFNGFFAYPVKEET